MAEAHRPQRASGLRNALANVLGLLVPLAVYLGATPVLVHGLGAAQFGVLTLFVAAILLVSSFDLGLSTGGVRALGRCLPPAEPAGFLAVATELWSALLLLGICFAVLVYLTGDALFGLVGVDVHALGEFGTLALPLAILFGFCSAAFAAIPRAMEMFVGLTVIQVLAGSLNWLGAVVLVRSGFGLEAVLLWFAAISGGACLALAWWANRLVGGFHMMPVVHFPALRHSFSFSLHAFLGQAASMGIYHADKFLVAHFLGAAAAGYYGLASSLAFRFLTLVAALSGFVFPRAVRLAESGDTTGLRETYLRASRYVLLISWPVLVVALSLGIVFLRFWVGDEVAEAVGPVLQVLLVAYFVAALSVVASQIFNGLGNARIGALFSVLGGAVNLVACLLLLPHWGVQGAALASLLSMLQVFGYTAALHRNLSLATWPFAGLWLRIFVASLVPLALLWPGVRWVDSWLGLFGLGFAGWLGFYAAWFCLRFADAGDRAMLLRVGGFISRDLRS